MLVRKAKVVGGKVTVEIGDAAQEGKTITVVLHDVDEVVDDLTPQEAEELSALMAEIQAGHGIPAEDVLATLPE